MNEGKNSTVSAPDAVSLTSPVPRTLCSPVLKKFMLSPLLLIDIKLLFETYFAVRANITNIEPEAPRFEFSEDVEES